MLMKRRRNLPVKEMRMAENPKPVSVQAAGGLLYRVESDRENPEILLIYRNDVWDLPKGKLEADESISECAAREVQEEVGLGDRPEIIAELGTTYHIYTLKDQEIEKETFWFVMRLSDESVEFTPEQAEGITRVEWVPAKKALQTVGYENLEKIIQRFLNDVGNFERIKSG